MFRRVCSIATPACVRGFAASTVALRKASPYMAYMRHVYATPALKKQLDGLPIPKRGKLMGQWWKKTSAAEKAKFAVKAKTIKVKKAVSKKAKFIERTLKTAAIKALPAKERLPAVTKEWQKKLAARK